MRFRTVLLAGALALACACGRAGDRPSFVIVVLDTVRADAVSAYGAVAGTTPNFDRLAGEGVRYAHAYANAGWTLPSHASLLTGLLPSRHRTNTVLDALPASVTTLAETLHAAGYETVMDAENPFLSPALHYGLDRGFERVNDFPGPGMREHLAAWLAERDPGRPFLLVLNIMDAHAPYRVRLRNRYLPPAVSMHLAEMITRDALDYVCVASPDDLRLAVLHGLYLGNVRAADAKLGGALAMLEAGRQAGRWRGPLVRIVVADHGEQFGERGLVRHEIGVAEPLVHVPLVVTGAPGAEPGVVEAPVQLVDVMPSILAWAGLPVPDGLVGGLLPVREPARASDRAIVAEWTDLATDEAAPASFRAMPAKRRDLCPPDVRVRGDMRALLRFPYKLRWYASYPPELFDVAADPAEREDVSASHPELTARLAAELDRLAPRGAAAPARSTVMPDPKTVKLLRELGYLDAGEPTQPAPAR